MATAAPLPITPDFATAYRDLALTSFESEVPVTRRVLEAVLDSKHDYRPDPKARTAWELACHIAKEDVLFLDQIAEGMFNFPDTRYDAQLPKTSKDLSAWYEKNTKRAMETLRKVSPAKLVTPVVFLGMFKFPVVLYLDFLIKHSVHHRGQLAAYLRPLGSSVPSIYGGSADEPMNF
jgi:uncharacterized damage-inducible protein DinB